MSNTRRSLGDALTSKKAQEFIHGPDTSVPKDEPNTIELKSEPQNEDIGVGDEPEATKKPTRKKKRSAAPSPEPVSSDVLVPLTTRVRQSTADAIERAYMEHRLKKLMPNTKQEIVEAALREWLGSNGFLS